MRRVKLFLATMAALVVMMVAAASPAVANHRVEWRWFWWDDEWLCWVAWAHKADGGWEIGWLGCVNVETRKWWIGVN